MNQLEFLREKLHKMIESGDINGMIETSQELDKVIIKHMEDNGKNEKQLPVNI